MCVCVCVCVRARVCACVCVCVHVCVYVNARYVSVSEAGHNLHSPTGNPFTMTSITLALMEKSSCPRFIPFNAAFTASSGENLSCQDASWGENLGSEYTTPWAALSSQNSYMHLSMASGEELCVRVGKGGGRRKGRGGEGEGGGGGEGEGGGRGEGEGGGVKGKGGGGGEGRGGRGEMGTERGRGREKEERFD